MKKLLSLEANHTKLKANFAAAKSQGDRCEISLWLRNHKRMAAKSALGCEISQPILHACEILLSASRYLRPTLLDFFLQIFVV